jgi:hypothetical protein
MIAPSVWSKGKLWLFPIVIRGIYLTPTPLWIVVNRCLYGAGSTCRAC